MKTVGASVGGEVVETVAETVGVAEGVVVELATESSLLTLAIMTLRGGVISTNAGVVGILERTSSGATVFTAMSSVVKSNVVTTGSVADGVCVVESIKEESRETLSPPNGGGRSETSDGSPLYAVGVGKGASVAPKGASVAPKGASVAPKGASVAPKGASVAPKGASVAPKGPSVAPKGASVPLYRSSVAPS